MNLLTIPGMVKAIQDLQTRVAELEKQQRQPANLPIQAPEMPLPAPRRGRPPKVAQEASYEEAPI